MRQCGPADASPWNQPRYVSVLTPDSSFAWVVRVVTVVSEPLVVHHHCADFYLVCRLRATCSSSCVTRALRLFQFYSGAQQVGAQMCSRSIKRLDMSAIVHERNSNSVTLIQLLDGQIVTA